MTHPNEIHAQLEECFAIVFPDLAPGEIPSATMESVSQWDSLGSLTLAQVLQEMFQVQIEVDDIPSLVSFEKIADYLVSRSQRAAA